MKKFLLAAGVITATLLCRAVSGTVVAAQDFGCGAYGSGDFGDGSCGGEVADTGLSVWLIRAGAVALILLAVFIVYKTSRKKK